MGARFRFWLRATVHRSRTEREMENELRFHIERYTEKLVRDGVPIEEARHRALAEFGAFEARKQECREALGLRLLDELHADLRYGFRMLCKSPTVTAVAIVSLALGIGANTAIFSLIDAIELRTLPVNHPESLVLLTSFSGDGKVGDFGYADYLVVRNGNRAFSGVLAASSQMRLNVEMGADSEVALRKIVSSNYFSVLGVQPFLGRGFSDVDESLQVAIISNGFWKRSLGGSPSVVGKQIDLDGVPFTIVGVAPPEFLGETVGEAPDIWATVSLMPASRRSLPGFTWLNLMGRLKTGVQPQQASADLSLLSPELPNSFIRRIAVERGDRGSSGLRDSFSAPLGILMAVVALVLLIACVNLASLQLARAATRQREIATRLTLGASRSRIGRQLMTEGLLLALLGGVLGLLFATWSERFLLSLVANVGRAITVDLSPDIHVLGFTAVMSVATAVLFGLAPALHAVRRGVSGGLKLGPRTFEGRGRHWGFQDGLIAMQVALSLLLLVVGGLFVRTLQNLKTQDLGFRARNVLSVQLGSGTEHQPPSASVIVPILQRTQTIPGVQAGSFSFLSTLADDGSGVNGLKFDGYPPAKENQRAQANWVGPNYFKTSGIPMLEGREFSLADNSKALKVAIVNQAIARHYFDNRSAVGKRFEFNKEQYEIVGVAKN
jgi:predicted permease